MRDEFRALLARHLPGYEVELVARLGEGLDNVSYEVNAELIVRKSKEPDPALRGEAVRREAELLAAVAELSTLPVPEPIFADPEAGVLAYPKLPGVPLMDHWLPEPARLAPALGGFLGRLHRIPLGEVEHLAGRDAYPLAAWRDDAEGDYRKISGHLRASARRRIEDFLGGALPAEARAEALCHNDLGAEHMLVDVRRNVVTGIIDWGDAAIGDPALDLALVYRDLGRDVFGCVLAHYVAPFDDFDRERAVFYARCKLIEDVAYGVSSPGTRRYAEAALAHLDRTFGDLA